MRIFELFFYLTIVLLPTQLGFHFWPDWALVLGRRVDYLAPTIFLTDITIAMTMLTWALQKNTRSVVIQTVLHYKFVIGFGAALVVLNIVFSTHPILSVMKWGKVLEYLFFFYFIYKAKPSRRITIYCIAVAILYASLIAIAQFIQQHTIGGLFWFLGERTFSNTTPGIAKVNWCWSSTNCGELLRPYATFPHPNMLGGFLATTLPILILSVTKETKKILRMALIAISTIGICVLGLTFSRSAWVIGGVALLWTLWHSAKKNWVTGIVCVMGVICLTVLTWPYIALLDKTNESVYIRLDLASAAVTAFLQHPFIGTGLGTFLPNLPYNINIRDLFFLQPVHNIYLLLMSETGIAGIGLAAIIGYIYKQKLKGVKYDKSLLVPIIAIGALGFFDHYPFTVQQGQLLTTCLLALPFFKTDS